MLKIQSTDNYSAFSRIDGNRNLKTGHISKLQQSISADPYLAEINPILVNDKMEIIDGQHRFEAIKRLQLPVHYIKLADVDLSHVQKLNANTRVWSNLDYARSYTELGNANYAKVLTYHQNYKMFGIDYVISLLGGQYTGSAVTQSFKDGKFIVKDEKNTKTILNYLVDIGEFFPDYKLTTFCRAFRKIYRTGKYNHKRFLMKLKKHADKIRPFHTVEDAQREIERIYNMNVAETQRVRFF
jgi:hypothetical protein